MRDVLATCHSTCSFRFPPFVRSSVRRSFLSSVNDVKEWAVCMPPRHTFAPSCIVSKKKKQVILLNARPVKRPMCVRHPHSESDFSRAHLSDVIFGIYCTRGSQLVLCVHAALFFLIASLTERARTIARWQAQKRREAASARAQKLLAASFSPAWIVCLRPAGENCIGSMPWGVRALLPS